MRLLIRNHFSAMLAGMQTEIRHPDHARLWNEGKSFAEIGKITKETRGAVAGKLHRMKGKIELRKGHVAP